MQRENQDGVGLSNGRGYAVGMTGIPLRDPGFLKSVTVEMPIALGVLFMLAAYFRPAALLAAVLVPPFAVWSWSLSRWARRQKLTGDQVADRTTRLETTIRLYLFVQVQCVAGSVAFLSIALAALTELGHVIGPVGYAVIICAYGLAFAASFVLPSWFLRLELDTERAEPRTKIGALLRSTHRLPTNPGLLAGIGLAVAALARAVLSRAWFAGFAGGLSLVASFGLILLTMTGFRKWQYLRRLRDAEFGGRD